MSLLKQGFYNLDKSICKFAYSKQISSDNYKLQHDFYYKSKDNTLFLIKKGFVHDGASKGFLKRFGRYTNAAILHDALYASKIVNKKRADELFFEAMDSSNVKAFRKYLYYYAVRVFGAFAWKNSKNIKHNRKYILKVKEEV